jgi:hypothetical protein
VPVQMRASDFDFVATVEEAVCAISRVPSALVSEIDDSRVLLCTHIGGKE